MWGQIFNAKSYIIIHTSCIYFELLWVKNWTEEKWIKLNFFSEESIFVGDIIERQI